MISIGIPFYNAEAYLDDAIKSVRVQTFKIWELILIDDGSIDRSLEIAHYHQSLDSRIKVISDGENKKLPYRLNQIISLAKYEYIARMDADDLMDVDRLKIQYEFLLKNPEIDLVTTGMYSIGKNNEILGVRIPKDYEMSTEEILNGVTNLLHASMLAKKSWCLRNLYRVDNALAEDYELWLTASLKKDLKYKVIQLPLYYYRETENVKKSKMIKGYNTQISIIKRYYSGVITEKKMNAIVIRFKFKIIIVNILDFLNLMVILEKKRVSKVSKSDEKKYLDNLNKIIHIGG